MKILAIDIRPIEQGVLDEIQPDFLGGSDDLDRVTAESDFLSVHLHLTPETHHIIDARRIGLMKPTAYLVNVARGGRPCIRRYWKSVSAVPAWMRSPRNPRTLTGRSISYPPFAYHPTPVAAPTEPHAKGPPLLQKT